MLTAEFIVAPIHIPVTVAAGSVDCVAVMVMDVAALLLLLFLFSY